ncbi:MAG: LamG domain-containing protein, partial [Planctomycetota bacterium]
MMRKLILLTSLVFVLPMAGNAWAGFNEPVDLALRTEVDGNFVPFPPTAKDDWTPWLAYGDTGEPHDARSICDVNGSGMCFGIASTPFGAHQQQGMSADPFSVDAICNTWLRCEWETVGSPSADGHLALWGPGLLAGKYEVVIYHNRTDLGGDPCDPNFARMPRVFVQSYCEANLQARYGRGNIDNIGAPLCDCNVVVPMVNDVNVWIQAVTSDAELIPSRVGFELLRDGNSVHIICEAPPAGSACINAFIVRAPSARWAFSPSPGSGSENVCPDVVLSWESGTEANDVNGQDLYFSSDYNDVNERKAAGHIGLQSDTNYAPPANLDWGQTYYWRVDTVNEPCMTPGTVWDFTVETGKAYNPSPPDGGWSVESTYVEWTPSCLATSHDIYYSTNWEDVNDGSAYLMTWFSPWFDFGGIMDPGKRYYWRIDENGPVTFPDGDVWTFQARGGAVALYTFDGPLDTNLPDPIEDDTENVEFVHCRGSVPYGHGPLARMVYGEANPVVSPLETGAHFIQGAPETHQNGLRRQVYGFDIIDLEKDGYTIEAWIKQEARTTDNTRSEFGGEDFAGSLFRKYDLSYAVGVGAEGALRFAHSGEDNVIATKAGAIPLNEWVHVAAVYDGDGSDPCTEQKLYIGGELVATGWAPTLNPYDDDDTAIGCAVRPRRAGYQRMGNMFRGIIDEMQISDIALPPERFRIRGDRRLAWLPKPSHGKTKVPIDTMLLWKPGELASSHDIYMGTSESDVNDANTSVTLGVFMGNREPNDYDPGALALAKTYYWRIDEVNDTNGATFKGGVWRFTTAGYVVIDDFEQYDQDNRIYYTWDDGQVNDSGSYIDL